jgi:hypothetical protein
MFELGNSDNAKIQISKLSYSSEDWFEYSVKVNAGSFVASINAFMQTSDFVAFRTQLIRLNKTLKGEAILLPREEQFTLKLKGNGMGQIEVSGEAFEVASYGNCLKFEFGLDQTYLAECIDSLDSILE